MGFFTSIIELLARFFLSIVFFINGLFKSTYYEETVEYMVDFNIPAILAIPTIIFEMIFPLFIVCLLYTSPSPRDKRQYRMPSSA